MSDADAPVQTTDEVGARGSRPRDLIARGVLTLALVGLIIWLLLSNVGELSDVVANDNVSGTTIVTIEASDEGFSSARCGTWTKR